MHTPTRSSFCATATALVLTTGAVAVAPVEISAGPVAPRVITAVKLVAAPGGFEGGWATEVISPLADLFDPAHSYTYKPHVSGPSVSHPVGLIPQLVRDLANPPVMTALITVTNQREPEKIQWGSSGADFAALGGYGAAASVVIRQHVHTAVHDTFTPKQWGGGKVLNDWANAARVREAMTFGVGAKVDGKWVPSIRVAAISTRNQIANNILGTQKYPNYARDYTPEVRTESGSVSNSGAPSWTNSAASTFASGRAH